MAILKDIKKAMSNMQKLREKSIKPNYPKAYDRYDPKYNLHH